MKVIFSRKGFDSENGGKPSIILPEENKMISFPIPVKAPEIGYKADEINFVDEDKTLADYLQELGIKQDSAYHVDPEIQNVTVKGGKNFVQRQFGTLGQWSSSAGHLVNNRIFAGEISSDNPAVFLFYGLFQKTKLDDKILRYTGKRFHAIWGYLIATEAVNVSDISDSNHPELMSHLHYINSSNRTAIEKNHKGKNNIIFKGERFGVFSFSDKLRLTVENETKLTRWALPSFIKEMTFIKIQEGNLLNDKLIIDAPSKGQEFIVKDFDDTKMRSWLSDLGVEF